MALVPQVIYNEGSEKHSMGLYSKLFDDRLILLNDPIDSEVMSMITSQLLFLNAKDSKAPIHLYISSPGGSVTDGYAIIDTMDTIDAPVHTYSLGLSASMAALIFICGEKRLMMPNSELMLHQPLGGVQGQATEIEITANRIIKMKNKINQLISSKSGQDLAFIVNETERDRFYDADEAIKLGLADEIISKKL